MDEMGYHRWAEPAASWPPCRPPGGAPAAPEKPPLAKRADPNNQQWCIIGVLNALTGQVNHLDGYIVGRQKVIDMYEYLNEVYHWASRIWRKITGLFISILMFLAP